MNQEYIRSADIEVFPIAKKRSNDAPGTRTFTERNISNLIRQLLSADKDGYIISCDQIDNKNKNAKFNIEFNLYGYYFEIKNFTPASTWESVYACIALNDGEIYGQDNNDKFEGLTISDNPSAVTIKSNDISLDIKYIKLLEKVDNSWRCASQNIGLISSLSVGGIDGKPRQ